MIILRHVIVCIYLLVSFCAFAQPASDNITSKDTVVKPLRDTTTITNTDTSSEKIFIASIAVYGNKKTKTYILEREIPFKQGDYILKKDLQKKLDLARRQLINTSLFLEADVRIENQTSDFVFITVNVKERWYVFPLPYFKLVDRNFNTWWVTYNHNFSRVNYGIKFLYNNVSGHNDKLNVFFITGYSHQVAFKYDRPYFDKTLKNGFNVSFNFSQQKEINFRTDSSVQKFLKTENNFIKQTMRISADYVYRPAIKTRHIFRLAYVNDKIDDTVINPIGGNPNYFPGNKTHIQFSTGAVVKVPFNQPFYNKQLFGYGNIFMQGLEYYVVDGVAGAVGRVTVARELLAVNLKTPESSKKKVEIPIKFYGKIFTNAGYGYDKNPGNSLLNNRLLNTYGFGLDVVIIYDIVLKFDYSFNQFGENGLFFHVKKDF